ncbi:hypothetical protein [Paraburkholderia phenoliruptrix]|nr:hypothetical protein [Paraburkholderia phenoliruptrix]
MRIRSVFDSIANRATEPIDLLDKSTYKAMFRPDDLMTVLELECALGGRRYGHFDHDAANITGPNEPSARGGAVLRVGLVGIGENLDKKSGEYLSTY